MKESIRTWELGNMLHSDREKIDNHLIQDEDRFEIEEEKYSDLQELIDEERRYDSKG